METTKVRFARWSCMAIAIGLAAGAAVARAQPPDAVPGPQAQERKGILHRWLHHSAATLQDKWIGYPETFNMPPITYFVREQMTMQVAKADPHRFTLYRDDFLPGTNQFSPTGAYRFNLMYSRLASWLGPVVVEWTPDEPGLAESRRQAILLTMQKAGQPIVPERVLIGPSRYPGAMGTEASNNFNTVLVRSSQAGITYPPTPQNAAYAYGRGAGAQ